MSEEQQGTTQSVTPTQKSDGPTAIQTGADQRTTIVTSTESNSRMPGEVSAITVARMMGLVTANEFKFLEGKLDLMSTKLNTVTSRMEKVVTMLSELPNGSDLERIDVQVGALRSQLSEALVGIQAALGIEKKAKEESLTVEAMKEKLAQINKIGEGE